MLGDGLLFMTTFQEAKSMGGSWIHLTTPLPVVTRSELGVLASRCGVPKSRDPLLRPDKQSHGGNPDSLNNRVADLTTAVIRLATAARKWSFMEEHTVTQTEHMATIEAHAVAQQVQQVHVATYTEHSMLSADEDSPSSPEDTSYDDSDILNSTAADEVTAHLAAAGPVGMAAAAAVATGKKRKRPHVFESNPSIRKRQQTRLLRKLRATLDEYTTRVGQQAIVLCISPSKPNPVFKVFGAAPLENVVRKYKSMILEDLESALLEHAPAPQEVNSELPPLTIDGIPVSVDKMTQAQLRAFIPEMLKYSTGRGKPGWGKESCKPIWWPEDIPWANVRSDVRTEEQKQRVSWTQALRTIVKNCYKQHGREDLLYAFEDQQTQSVTATHSIAHLVPSQTMVQTFSNPDGTVSLIQVGTGATVATLADASELPTTVTVAQVNYSAVTDGEVEQNWATLQGGEMTIQTTQASEATQAVASLAEAAVAASQEIPQGATVTMALNSFGFSGSCSMRWLGFMCVCGGGGAAQVPTCWMAVGCPPPLVHSLCKLAGFHSC
ncbi:nuclear respiratory factor 1 isoform X3 [Crotalus tigris]|uniref:nuclear respiratory factor 1 isoform X3 n=1 Tax=Crotalus tigris TaxID=88082 RepID=UPI00192FA93A|nr:nuclear respiratory factor 1 isoform X3 [Crotalus tigris]